MRLAQEKLHGHKRQQGEPGKLDFHAAEKKRPVLPAQATKTEALVPACARTNRSLSILSLSVANHRVSWGQPAVDMPDSAGDFWCTTGVFLIPFD